MREVVGPHEPSPVHVVGAGELDGEKAPGRVVAPADLVDVQPAGDVGELLAEAALEVGLRRPGERRTHPIGEDTAEGDGDVGRGLGVEPLRGVQAQEGVDSRHIDLRLDDGLQRCALRSHRQAPLVLRRQHGMGIAVAGAGPIQPVGLVLDLHPHDHMVEDRQRRRQLVDPVPAAQVHQHRLGVEVEVLQQRQQKRGLGLAIAEPPGPGVVGIGRHITALAHAEEEIAGLVLDELQGGEGALLGVLGPRGDGVGLGLDRRRR